MRSTFMGLEASKRGMFTQQSALYTTGHNISNANTLGYSRQRVNMETTPGFPGAGLNSGKTAGHIGTGVQASSVQRIRDEFVDRQYRQETNKLGYWQSTTQSISQMEDVMSEPSEFGMNQAFTEFWKSMEDVVTNPKDTAARQVMISKGQSLAESFNYMDTQLKQIQGNIGNEINVVTSEVNSLLKQIADINKQVQAIEPNGYMPNDLYDARDVLLDKLNDIIPVSISFEKSGGNALAIAEGSMTVTFKPVNGDPIILVHSKSYAELSTMDSKGKPVDGDVDEDDTAGYASFSGIVVKGSILKEENPNYDATTNPTVSKYHYKIDANPTGKEVAYNQLEDLKGKLAALIDAYGYVEKDSTGTVIVDGNGKPIVKGIYPEMLQKLDKLASEFINAFNGMHAYSEDPVTNAVINQAYNLKGDKAGNFFDGTTAKNMKVLDGMKPEDIAASNVQGEEGNNKNILALSALQSAVQGNLQGGTFQSFYKSLIGELGVKGQQALTLEYNSTTLLLQIENNRASHNSVSLDEEMTNMITFQQAYNANARMITVIDETLDKIINGMGRAGL